MITFYQHIEEIKKSFKISDAEQIASLKRWYNQGCSIVKKKLMRRTNAEVIYANIVANQSEYQLPEYAGRVFNIRYNETGSERSLTEVTSGIAWDELKSNGSQTGLPSHYHLLSEDEIELWPTPSQAVTDGLEVRLAFKHSRLSADDISTGTATASNGSQTVTISSSIVTTNWVGRMFTVNNGHEEWYRISEYVSSTSFKLENYFEGDGGAGLSYIVGEVVDIPEEYIHLPELFTRAKYTEVYRKNRGVANDMMKQFKDEIKELNQSYSSPSKGKVVKNRKTRMRAYPYGTPWYFEDQLS